MELVSMGLTSDIHTNLNFILGNELGNKLRKFVFQKKAFFSQGTTRLAHYGKRLDLSSELIDIAKIANHADFTANHIHNYSAVEPDLLVFHKNEYIKNQSGTYFAGFPDLVVEIWSDSNDSMERKYKKAVYSSSPKTEHWYFEQGSDLVERWLGKTQLETLSIREKLTTQNGLELDISDFVA